MGLTDLWPVSPAQREFNVTEDSSDYGWQNNKTFVWLVCRYSQFMYSLHNTSIKVILDI